MKKSLKYTALALAALMCAGLAGCGKDNADSSVNADYDSEYLISDEPIELTCFFIRNDSKYSEDLDMWKKAAEMTNVSLKTVSSKNVSDKQQAFNTMLASGNIPDIVVYDDAKTYLSQYGQEGAFEPIDELIKEYAPHIQKEFDRPEIKNYVTASDGHIYYVPSMNQAKIAAGWFIRQDWLDKLGLPMPTTVDEYHDTLLAFRNNDPNGNGIQDEVPYFSRFNGMGYLLYLWDATETFTQKDGVVYYGPTGDEFKTGYANITKWYNEGLIDKEIYTRGGKSRDKLLGENVGGSTHDWFGSTAQFNDMLKESVPGINFVAFAPPNGKEYVIREQALVQGAGISANSKYKVEAVKFMDFFFSDAGSKLMNFGLEGVHYDMVDGKPVFRDFVIHGDKTAIDILQEAGSCSQFPYMQDFWYEEQWLNDTAKAGVELYLDNNYLVDPFPTLSFTQEEQDLINEKMPDIQTYLSETTQEWVFGNKDVESEFAGFVEQLKKLGIDEVTEVYQAAYDRYLGK